MPEPAPSRTNGNGSLGLTGWWRLAGNASAMALIAGSFLWLQYTLTTQNRADRLDDRVNFQRTLEQIEAGENRRNAEIRDSMEANRQFIRELKDELRAIRRDAAKPPGKEQ